MKGWKSSIYKTRVWDWWAVYLAVQVYRGFFGFFDDRENQGSFSVLQGLCMFEVCANWSPLKKKQKNMVDNKSLNVSPKPSQARKKPSTATLWYYQEDQGSDHYSKHGSADYAAAVGFFVCFVFVFLPVK